MDFTFGKSPTQKYFNAAKISEPRVSCLGTFNAGSPLCKAWWKHLGLPFLLYFTTKHLSNNAADCQRSYFHLLLQEVITVYFNKTIAWSKCPFPFLLREMSSRMTNGLKCPCPFLLQRWNSWTNQFAKKTRVLCSMLFTLPSMTEK